MSKCLSKNVLWHEDFQHERIPRASTFDYMHFITGNSDKSCICWIWINMLKIDKIDSPNSFTLVGVRPRRGTPDPQKRPGVVVVPLRA